MNLKPKKKKQSAPIRSSGTTPDRIKSFENEWATSEMTTTEIKIQEKKKTINNLLFKDKDRKKRAKKIRRRMKSLKSEHRER